MQYINIVDVMKSRMQRAEPLCKFAFTFLLFLGALLLQVPVYRYLTSRKGVLMKTKGNKHELKEHIKIRYPVNFQPLISKVGIAVVAEN